VGFFVPVSRKSKQAAYVFWACSHFHHFSTWWESAVGVLLPFSVPRVIQIQVCLKYTVFCSERSRRIPRKGSLSLQGFLPGPGVGLYASFIVTKPHSEVCGLAVWGFAWLWTESLWKDQAQAPMLYL
jgi:hypothetical protein